MPFKLPATLPAVYKANPGTVITNDVDGGGWDFTLGGYGFRLATDTNNPYQRVTEPTTLRRFDNSLEPGEQTLSQLPWIKSQASFHGGAGQLNLEQGFTAFQYQQEQVEHIRFDNCLGVNVWTPGQVTRLPDSKFTSFSGASGVLTSTSAYVGGVEYVIVGGTNLLSQVAFTGGPDAAPTVTPISLTGSTFVNAANCTVTSLCTDGTNYYGVLQMAADGYVSGLRTYIIKGSCASTAQPTALYEVPNYSQGAPRTNLCTNPSFETNTTGWSAAGTQPPTIATSATQAFSRTHSLLITWATGNSIFNQAQFSFTATAGTTYTVSAYVYVPAGSPAVGIIASNGGSVGPDTGSAVNQWVRLNQTFKATSSGATGVGFYTGNVTAGQTAYIDAVLIEVGATLGTYFDGATAADGTYNYAWSGTADASTSTATPVTVAQQSPGIVGWQKARLVAGLANSFYELSPTASAHSALPSARYTHPSTTWTWTDTANSPKGILAAGLVNQKSEILEFVLDTSGGTPFLSGGASVAEMPAGETITALQDVISSFLAVGTTKGVRVGTYDRYSGTLQMGPVSITLTSTTPGFGVRDRFIYSGYSNQQADGTSGLVALDTSYVVDAAGRFAYAPDLRPPTTATSRTGTVLTLGALPFSGRLFYIVGGGINVEGNGPGTNDVAWLRTSRIRYDTAEPKLFKLGRVHGALDVANISITGIAPFGVSKNLGTFGFITGTNPGEFRLPGGTNEWIQLQFELDGAACVLNSYQAKALPAPSRQHLITLTANCYRYEADKFGGDMVNSVDPRTRFQQLKDLEAAGNEIRFVEFTSDGPVAELVVIEQLAFISETRPHQNDTFGGKVTIKLRTTES